MTLVTISTTTNRVDNTLKLWISTEHKVLCIFKWKERCSGALWPQSKKVLNVNPLASRSISEHNKKLNAWTLCQSYEELAICPRCVWTNVCWPKNLWLYINGEKKAEKCNLFFLYSDSVSYSFTLRYQTAGRMLYVIILWNENNLFFLFSFSDAALPNLNRPTRMTASFQSFSLSSSGTFSVRSV